MCKIFIIIDKLSFYAFCVIIYKSIKLKEMESCAEIRYKFSYVCVQSLQLYLNSHSMFYVLLFINH